jgi:hypothetical protein
LLGQGIINENISILRMKGHSKTPFEKGGEGAEVLKGISLS